MRKMQNTFTDLAVGFHRVNNTPLDDTTMCEDIRTLHNYIEYKTAYEGQRILIPSKNINIQVTLVKSSDDKLVPVIMNWPNNIEIVTKSYDGSKYIMVYYYNNGTPYASALDTYRVNNSYAWSILPFIGILAGSDDLVSYVLEVNGKLYPFNEKSINLFQTEEDDIEFTEDYINGIYNYGNGVFHYCTSNLLAGIMPKDYNSNITKLWVKADTYCELMGVK